MKQNFNIEFDSYHIERKDRSSRGGGGFDDAKQAHVDNLNNDNDDDGFWDK